MSSPIYQYVIDLVVSLPIGRVAGVFMNVPVWEHGALYNQIFHAAMFTILNTIIITILMQTIIPNCLFENIISPHFCIKIS